MHTFSGEILTSESAGFEQAYAPAVARFASVRPHAVVRCRSAADVAGGFAYARSEGLPVVPRGGGHCGAGRSSTDGVLLDLSPMDTVDVDPSGRAVIGAGARLAAIYDVLHRHGRVLPAGCGPTVGIVGLTLGGGIGLLGRAYGLTCDWLREAEVVLPSGDVVVCDANREPDLFWALRGAGGGQFGVVTQLVFDTAPEPVTTRFVLTWSIADASAVVAAWQRWAPVAPDGVTAVLKIAVSAETSRVTVFGVALDDTDAHVASFVAAAGVAPTSTEVARLVYRDLKRSLTGVGAVHDSTESVDVHAKSEFFARPLPQHAVDELLHGLARDGEPGAWRELTCTPMGGAFGRVPADATAFAHRDELFMLEHAATGSPSWPRASAASMRRWASGRVYSNFPDPDLIDWPRAYHGDNYARLVRVKRRYDPDGVLSFRQSIPVHDET